MNKSAAWYRARIKALTEIIATLPPDSQERKILMYGSETLLAGSALVDFIEDKILSYVNEQSNEPLTFVELTQFNTFFLIHPKKVAGKERLMTSREFPITIEGAKQDIINTLKVVDKNTSKNTKMMKLKAKALNSNAKAKLSIGLQGTGDDTAIKNVIAKSSNGLSGLGRIKSEKDINVRTFDEIIATYNKGISEDELKAWAWSKEYSVNGWRKYKNLTKEEIHNLVLKGALYYLDSDLVTYPEYAYGNMYERELQLERDKDVIVSKYGQKVYEIHKKVINEQKPKLLSIQNPDKRERPVVLAISKFVKDFRLTQPLREETGFKSEVANDISLVEYFKWWLINSLKKTDFVNVNASEIWNYYILNKSFSKYDSEAYREKIETYAAKEGEELFTRFLHEALSVTDQQRFDFAWNRTFNGWSALPYSRVPIGFECSSKFKNGNLEFTPIQREGIAFMEVAGSGICAFDVGVGKTMTANITLANALYSGRCSRPFLVVPNATYKKWTRELFGYTDEKTGEYLAGVFSGTKFKLNDWFNLGTEVLVRLEKEKKVNVTVNKIGVKVYDFKKVEANTITLLTYEGFAKLGFGEKLQKSLLKELNNILSQASSANDTRSQRNVEQEQQRYAELISVGNSGTIVDIDELGLDYIVIDEAHNFKNVFSYVPVDEQGDKRFNIESGQSSRAIKAFFICNYIQRTYGQNVLLLTATPFTNNPIEIYSMLSLVAHKRMGEMGISNLYDFMEQFILQSYEWVNTVKGTIVRSHVVKQFNNKITLQKLIFNHINYKTGEEAGVKRPCKINLPKLYELTEKGREKLPKDKQLTTFLKMTPQQEENQQSIIKRAEAIGLSFMEKKKAIMQALSLSLDNALSPFIYDHSTPANYLDFVENSPKIYYTLECIRSVKKYHEDRDEQVSGQVIYMNRGKDYFKYVKEYLEKELGYKSKIRFNGKLIDEVEIITGEVNQDTRELIKDAFLDGTCKIIIGTATIREGIDLQRKGTVLFNLYPDWNPTDLKQLEGRIWRQGNTFGYVRIVMPLVQNSMDVFVFQKLEEKSNRINDIWSRADRGNVIEIESIDPEEVKFALFTNLNELSKIFIEKAKIEVYKELEIVKEDLKTVKEIEFALSKIETFKNEVIQSLQNAKSKLADFKIVISDRYVNQYWAGFSEKQLLEYEERALELAKRIERLEEQAFQDNKELIDIHNSLSGSVYQNRSVVRLNQYYFDMFKTYFIEIEKAKKTTFEKNGWSISTDFAEIIAELDNKNKKVQQQLKEVESPEFKQAIIIDIAKKKEANKVEGRDAIGASSDFKSLNYLLDFKFNEIKSNECMLPSPQNRPTIQPMASTNQKFKLLRLKAKAANTNAQAKLTLQQN